MTQLLSRVTSTARQTAPTDAGRPLVVNAVIAGVVASVGVMLACIAVGLAGWFASDAGAHGETTDAVRVGADAWLMAQGSGLALGSTVITAVPLGLTLVCIYVAYRMGRWAAAGAVGEDLRTVLTAGVVLAGSYGVVAVVAAVLATAEQAQARPGVAFLGGFLVAFLGGAWGLTSEALPVGPLLPEEIRRVGFGAIAAVLVTFAASAVVLGVALLLDLGSAANVLARLHTGVSGALLYTVLVAAVVPNAILLTGSYLLGPGFAIGTGTVVSPTAVILGPVPAFPLLAALPADGATPFWTPGLMAIPALASALAAGLMVRRSPAPGYQGAAVRGLLAGIVGGLVLAVLIALAGGAVGPGRMGDVGADLAEVALAAAVTMGLGGVLGAVVATWWTRRGTKGSTSQSAQD